MTEVRQRVAKSMRDRFPALFGDVWEEASDFFYKRYDEIHKIKLGNRPAKPPTHQFLLTQIPEEQSRSRQMLLGSTFRFHWLLINEWWPSMVGRPGGGQTLGHVYGKYYPENLKIIEMTCFGLPHKQIDLLSHVYGTYYPESLEILEMRSFGLSHEQIEKL